MHRLSKWYGNIFEGSIFKEAPKYLHTPVLRAKLPEGQKTDYFENGMSKKVSVYFLGAIAFEKPMWKCVHCSELQTTHLLTILPLEVPKHRIWIPVYLSHERITTRCSSPHTHEVNMLCLFCLIPINHNSNIKFWCHKLVIKGQAHA